MYECPAGTYREAVNVTSISGPYPFVNPTIALSYSPTLDNVTHCDSCPYGTYRSSTKGTSPASCSKCPIGKYANQTGYLLSTKVSSDFINSIKAQLRRRTAYGVLRVPLQPRKEPDFAFVLLRRVVTCPSQRSKVKQLWITLRTAWITTERPCLTRVDGELWFGALIFIQRGNYIQRGREDAGCSNTVELLRCLFVDYKKFDCW